MVQAELSPRDSRPPDPSRPVTTTPTSRAPCRPRLDWATLQARTFGLDVLRCGFGGRLSVHSVVTSARAAEEVLRNVGLWQPRLLLPPPRGPPQLELVAVD